MKENEVYGVSIKEAGQLQEDVLMSRNACYVTTQDLHTTGDVNHGYVPKKDHTDIT